MLTLRTLSSVLAGIAFAISASGLPLTAQVPDDDPIGPGGFITPAPASAPASRQTAPQVSTVEVQVCVPQNLGQRGSWDNPAPGSNMAAFKSLLRRFIRANGNPQMEYWIRDDAFDRFNEASASYTPDPRALLEEVSARQACPPAYDRYTLTVAARATSQLPEQNTAPQRPAMDYPPDRRDPVAIKCDELADTPTDPQRIGNGVDFNQIDIDKALPVCEQAVARQLRPRYQFLYGRVLDAAQRYAEAARQYAMADQSGYARAAFNLGELYANGQGVEKNIPKAISLYIRAGNAGFFNAFAKGGWLYMEETPPNYREAAALLEPAARGGSAMGLALLGELYEGGYGVRKDPAMAAKLYGEAAKRDDVEGMFRLGRLYLTGLGVQRDPPAACQLFYRAALRGHPDAEGKLGNCFYLGEGTTKDHQAAFAWYMKSAQAGSPLAQWFVASMYEQGDGVPQSDSNAVAWYAKAAAQNVPYAMAELGNHLRLGRGVAWNEPAAMQWFGKAAGLGNVEAMTSLGLGYKDGLGGGLQDYRLAARWFRQAASQNDGFAQINLGFLYEKGWGVEQDFDQARRLYARAAGSSVPEIANLGRRYFSSVQDSPGSAPERTVVSSSRESSDFWAKAALAALVIGAVALATSSDSTSPYIPPYTPPPRVDRMGRPCYIGDCKSTLDGR